jgi:hypothetical protein
MLSVNLWKRLQLGIFQGMIWEGADSTNRQHVNFNTFNPVIGVNAAVYGLHDQNNVLLGGTLRLRVSKSISLYGQFMMDDVYSEKAGRGDIRKKYGYQAGFKYHDLFTIRNLHIQAEYNSVRPYAYAAEDPEQSYTHYNQALAHPLGANFNEAVGFLNYRLWNFYIELKGSYAERGSDTTGHNFGSNIFKTDNSFPLTQKLENIHTTQGLKTTITYQEIQLGYLVNPATNFNIFIGYTNRTTSNERTESKAQLIYFGLRTSLANYYYDF